MRVARPLPVLPSALLFLLLAALLAGCSGGGPKAPAEIVVNSTPLPEENEVRSNESVPAVFTPSPKTRGHIAGVVVDEAIRPIEGAKIHLPGLDLERVSDRDGSFGFVDLHPGPYFITINATGFMPAEAVLEVQEDKFTRAKVILTRIPPPDPYHVTQSFEGYADFSEVEPNFVYGLSCGQCDFDLYIDRPGLKEVIIEAYLENAVQGDGFRYDLSDSDCCSYYTSGSGGTPLRVQVRSEDLGEGDHFDLGIYPTAFPVPEQGKRFQVFVTAFYNEVAPTGWAIANGDQ